jgi:acyl carrier protein
MNRDAGATPPQRSHPMTGIERIRRAVYRTLEDINDLLPSEQVLEVGDDLVLIGNNAGLDSMGFVNFIVALEEELERELGRDLNITELLNIQTDHSISTVADLINVLVERLK